MSSSAKKVVSQSRGSYHDIDNQSQVIPTNRRFLRVICGAIAALLIIGVATTGLSSSIAPSSRFVKVDKFSGSPITDVDTTPVAPPTVAVSGDISNVPSIVVSDVDTTPLAAPVAAPVALSKAHKRSGDVTTPVAPPTVAVSGDISNVPSIVVSDVDITPLASPVAAPVALSKAHKRSGDGDGIASEPTAIAPSADITSNKKKVSNLNLKSKKTNFRGDVDGPPTSSSLDSIPPVPATTTTSKKSKRGTSTTSSKTPRGSKPDETSEEIAKENFTPKGPNDIPGAVKIYKDTNNLNADSKNDGEKDKPEGPKTTTTNNKKGK